MNAIATITVSDLRRFKEFLGTSKTLRDAIDRGKIIVQEKA